MPVGAVGAGNEEFMAIAAYYRESPGTLQGKLRSGFRAAVSDSGGSRLLGIAARATPRPLRHPHPKRSICIVGVRGLPFTATGEWAGFVRCRL